MNDLLILATLLDGPQHGYALKKQAGFISGQPELHNNLVYPLLRRFVERGWVTRKETAGQRGQVRQMYSLTPPGRQELIRRLREFDGAEVRSPEGFRLRVGFFEALDPAARDQILEKRKSFLEARDGKFANLERDMDLGRYGGEVVRFLRWQIRAELAWIDRLRRIALVPKRKVTQSERRK
ncbi:MAG: PadR family transcriptional regulator [Candidatus Acidiferrales bacterium]